MLWHLLKITRRRLRWRDAKRCFSADQPVMPFDCGPDLEDRGVCAVTPCDATKCYHEPRVVIIGAGMAGLSAASRLAQRGINNIVVLEAYERPGGRILSCWLGDIVAELGSHLKLDPGYTHPVYTMSTLETPPRPGVPGAEHTRGLFSTVVSDRMAFPPTINAYYKFRQIEKEAAQIYCLGNNKQQGSLVNFMSLRIQQELHQFPEEQQHDAARVMFGLFHMLTARYGDDTSMLCADHSGCFMNMPGGEVRVPLGLIGILAPLLKNIPEGAIRYCKPVNCVYWGTSHKAGYRAIVCTNDGEEFPCDYVIITVSLGVLANNAVKMFCPALPASKCDAMRCLGFGFCNKIYMEYCRPFWFWHKGNLNFRFDNGQPFESCDWTRGLTSIETVPNSKHVVCAWIVGQEAMAMEGLCDGDVAEGLTKVLRCCTGNMNIPYPATILRSHWSTDPYFLGAYSYITNEYGSASQRSLACPIPGPSEPIPPVLLFAGEATVPGHYATVSGARLSGIREAERVLQLTLRYKGPPLPIPDISKPKQSKKSKGKKKKQRK